MVRSPHTLLRPMKAHNEIRDLGVFCQIIMVIRTKSCSILGTFCFRVGSVIALAGTRDLLAIGAKSDSFSKVFWKSV